MATIVKQADAGWIVGDANQYDPCIEPHAPRNVIIAFVVFAVLLLLLLLDGCLVAFADVDILVSLSGQCLPSSKTGEGAG